MIRPDKDKLYTWEEVQQFAKEQIALNSYYLEERIKRLENINGDFHTYIRDLEGQLDKLKSVENKGTDH